LRRSSLAAFLYPGYASYKTLAQRPASEADLERWLMYWSVLGCIGVPDLLAHASVPLIARGSRRRVRRGVDDRVVRPLARARMRDLTRVGAGSRSTT
jgi:hypothetical protein